MVNKILISYSLIFYNPNRGVSEKQLAAQKHKKIFFNFKKRIDNC